MIRLIEQRETLLCIFCNEYHFVTSISVENVEKDIEKKLAYFVHFYFLLSRIKIPFRL